MENILFITVVFLFAALIVHAVSERYGFNVTLGYMIVGVIMKLVLPHMLQDTLGLESIAHFGILFLLFAIGMHLPLEKLKSFKQYIFPLGVCQILFGTIIFFIALKIFGISNNIALNIAFGASLSSTAVALQILTGMNDLQSKYGRASFAVLLTQDIVVVLVLAINSGNYSNGLDLQAIGTIILKSTIALSTIIIAARGFLNKLYQWASTNSPEAFISVILINVCGISAITQATGMSMELGAFVAGVLLSGSEYKYQIQADLRSIRGLLIGLYFTTIGLMIDCDFVIHNIWIVLFLSFSFVILKFLSAFLACYISKISIINALKTSAILSAGGEFAFVLLKSPDTAIAGIDNNIKQFVIISTTLAIACSSFIVKLVHYITQFMKEKINKNKIDKEHMTDHIIIAGFGNSGRAIAEIMQQANIAYVGIDYNPEIVNQAVQDGFQVFYGDVRSNDIFRELNITECSSVVITINNDQIAARATIALRRSYSDIPLFMRSNRNTWIDKFQSFGIVVIAPKTLELNIQLATSVLEHIPLHEEAISKIVHDYYSHKNNANKAHNNKDDDLEVNKQYDVK